MKCSLHTALLARPEPYRGGVREKVKGLLRKAEARTREALVEAMGGALDAVTAKDAGGFFEHCGYRTMVQPF